MKSSAGIVEGFKPPRFADHVYVNTWPGAGIAERFMELLSGRLSDCDLDYRASGLLCFQVSGFLRSKKRMVSSAESRSAGKKQHCNNQ